MITFIAFLLTLAGCINWLLIGLLQYDFIAGFFGFQASIFSRLFYILFGIGALYLVIRVIVNKGTFKVFERKKKKEKEDEKTPEPARAYANAEASKEFAQNDQNQNKQAPDFSKLQEDDKEQDNLFDEHFK